ncbi:MAG: winged helix DNA-binding domain-containing protein [Bacteroidia bacterium]
MTDNLTQISHIRLASQQIPSTTLKTIPEMISWMGAMQAQDYPMAKWAMGIRLPGTTDVEIESAINTAAIIRTHVMRPTWHFVSPEDVYWMLALTGPRIKASMKSRHIQLELTEEILRKCYQVLEKSLEGGNHLTRDEIVKEFERAGVVVDNSRAAHIMMRAEIEMLVCNGVVKGKKQTYALLEERVPMVKKRQEEEALAKLAEKYFFSHGPATLQDFIWWSGLTTTSARKAWEMIRPDLEVIKDNTGQVYGFLPKYRAAPTSNFRVYLLPAFDEYYVSYKDRRAAISSEDFVKAVSNNGVFRPIVVVNGEIRGIWNRTAKKNHLEVKAQFFRPPEPEILAETEKSARVYGRFCGFDVTAFEYE